MHEPGAHLPDHEHGRRLAASDRTGRSDRSDRGRSYILTEKTLVDSGWYPKGMRSSEGKLRYYASQFPIVENDSMYYALAPPERAELWVERTPPGFAR